MLTHVRLTVGQEKSQINVEWLRNVEMSDQTESESSLLAFRPLFIPGLLRLIKRASKINIFFCKSLGHEDPKVIRYCRYTLA